MKMWAMACFLVIFSCAPEEVSTTYFDRKTDGGTATKPAATPREFPAFTKSGNYGVFLLHGFEVHMNQQVIDNQTLAFSVIDLLESDLKNIEQKIPPAIFEALKKVHIYVEKESASPGGVYHPSAEWLSANGFPTEWAGHIQIGNASNYLSWTKHQPALVLHELAHAWHHQHWGTNDAFIQDAYNQAMAKNLYASVKYYDGTNKPAYGATNHREYFAELSEAWFWKNDFYPFIRTELQTHDAIGAAAMQKAWAP